MNSPILNYSILGSGDPLFIIHGLFGSSRNWKSLSQRFAKHFQVISVDLRNHGDSFHSDVMDYRSMAIDIESLFSELGIRSAHIIGHSMGGKVAMKLCHLRPDLVSKLIIADIAPVNYSHGYDEIINAAIALDLSNLKNRKQADETLSQSISDQRIRLFILQNLAFREGDAYWKLNWLSIKDNMSSLTGFESIEGWSISQDSFFIRGALSDYVSDQAWNGIKNQFLHSQLFTLPNAGHWLHAERPAEFYDAVSGFLNRD